VLRKKKLLNPFAALKGKNGQGTFKGILEAFGIADRLVKVLSVGSIQRPMGEH